MSVIIGRNVRVEVAKTFGTAKTVSDVSNAKPAVATSTAHGLAAKSVGYFDGVTGMTRLDGQAVRIAVPTADTFTLEGLNTTTFPDYTGGNFIPVTAWATLAEATSLSVPDGTADELDNTTLIDDDKQLLNGLLNARTVAIAVNAQDVATEAGELIEDAADLQGYVLIRVTFKSGATRVFRGQPSSPGENVQRGAIATGSININVKGKILKGAA